MMQTGGMVQAAGGVHPFRGGGKCQQIVDLLVVYFQIADAHQVLPWRGCVIYVVGVVDGTTNPMKYVLDGHAYHSIFPIDGSGSGHGMRFSAVESHDIVK